MIKENVMKELYPFIFRRKSTRKYTGPVGEEELNMVSASLKELEPLLSSEVELKIVGRDDVRTGMQRPAPHYIAAFADGDEGKMNAGFMLQQMDLKLSSMGIGSCWQGIPSPGGHLKSELEFVIFLALGEAGEPVHRSRSEFRRKPLSEITDITGMDDVLEAVRLAPSAVNNQPWYLTGGDGEIHAYCRIHGPIKRRLVGRWNPIDMGIALAHLQISLQHHGYRTGFRVLEDPMELKNFRYTRTFSYMEL